MDFPKSNIRKQARVYLTLEICCLNLDLEYSLIGSLCSFYSPSVNCFFFIWDHCQLFYWSFLLSPNFPLTINTHISLTSSHDPSYELLSTFFGQVGKCRSSRHIFWKNENSESYTWNKRHKLYIFGKYRREDSL